MSDGIRRRALLPAAAGVLGLSHMAAASVRQVAMDQLTTILEPGEHRVTANITLKGDLLVKPGATIYISSGCTLTVLGGMVAAIAPIFTGPGRVDLNRSRVGAAHPEWWGAQPGNGRFDSLAALQNCLRAHPIMQLLPGDYYISDTLVVDRAFARITGAGFRGTEAGQGTRLIVTNGTSDVLLVGPRTKAASVANFLQNIEVRGLALSRSKPVVQNGDLAPAGLRAQYLLFAHFEQVSAFEHANGFVLRGLVRSTMRDCVAFRSLPGASGRQPYRGFWLQGTEEIGLAGGNASLYLYACNATIGGTPGVSDGVGLLMDGAFADCFVIDFEATAVECGIRVDGMRDIIGGRSRHGHANLHLNMPIIDQCGRVGIEIKDTSPQSAIDISGAYVAASMTTDAAVRLDRVGGAVSITGGQLLGGVNSAAGGSAAGLVLDASRSIAVNGLKIVDHAQPVRLTECSGFSLCLAVTSPGTVTDQPAIRVERGYAGSIAPTILADRRAFKFGVSVDSASTQLSVCCAGIAQQAVGGLANRASIAGQARSAPYRDANIVIEGP